MEMNFSKMKHKVTALVLMTAAVWPTVKGQGAESSNNLSALSHAQRVAMASLTLKGAVSAEDFRIIRDEMVNLTTLDMSATTVTALPDKAFAGMSKLTDIKLPTGLTSIGDGAFLTVGGVTTVEIPAGVTRIGALAFSRSGLTSVTVPAGVTEIGSCAFFGCNNLSSITVAGGNAKYTSAGGALFSADGMRLIKRAAKSTETLTLPSTLKVIEAYACDGCTGLAMPVLPQGLDSIGDYAFNNCRSMSGQLKLPSSLRHIGRGAFFGATAVTKSVALPTGIKRTTPGAFAYMSSLKGVELHEGVEYIAPSTFECDGALSTIKSPNTTPPTVGAFGMRGVDRSSTFIDVPESSRTLYRKAPVWEEFQNYTNSPNGGYSFFDESGDYRIKYVGDGPGSGKYVTMVETYGGAAALTDDRDAASVWNLEFFTVGYSALKFNGEQGCDIRFYLGNEVHHINFQGNCYIDPAASYGSNANRTFGLYMHSLIYDANEGPLVAIAGNGTIWKATATGENVTTRSFSDNYPLESDFVFRIEPRDAQLAAIGDISADGAEGPVRYYNLQGVEVKHPEHGIFIKVTSDGKATKVRL